MPTKYMSTITAIAVHADSESAIYGVTSTTVRLDDEGAGAYIVLDQGGYERSEPGIVKLNPEELPHIWEAMQKLLRQEGMQS